MSVLAGGVVIVFVWKPWERSTGPKSPEGKRRSAMRAAKTGEHSAEIRELRKLMAAHRRLLRDVKDRV